MVKPEVLITGGAGFIGSNLAHSLMRDGQRVRIFDNLSRPGADKNLEWLNCQHPSQVDFILGDVRDFPAVQKAVQDMGVIYHFASQVAVTTSVTDPRSDFEINALGAFNVLEAARLSGNRPAVGFTSTNKVYGGMEDVAIVEQETRYAFRDFPNGIPETHPLDFHSPYGCSKGAADQYMRDYARIYGLPTVVFRMSCIYGTHQFGVEDQGWVAHMVIAAALGRSLNIYGNGKQVRDLLWIEDLIAAWRGAMDNIDQTKGQVFNLGGGQANTISIWREFGPILQELSGHATPINQFGWRPGDQLIYVADTSKIRRELGWEPKVSARQGIETLYRWVMSNKELFQR